MEDQEKKKIYIRTFKFSDGTEKSVEGTGEEITTYTGKWARAKFNKEKIKETKDTVRYEELTT